MDHPATLHILRSRWAALVDNIDPKSTSNATLAFAKEFNKLIGQTRLAMGDLRDHLPEDLPQRSMFSDLGLTEVALPEVRVLGQQVLATIDAAYPPTPA